MILPNAQVTRRLDDAKFMFRTIIVPLDGSILAVQALPVATNIAAHSGASLVLLAVHQPPAMPMANGYEWDEESRQREVAYLGRMANHVRHTAGARPETLLVRGHPAEAIAKVAAGRDQPLVVMSSHGRTGVSRSWIGSITDEVLRRGSTPVLMVRIGEEPAAEAADSTEGDGVAPISAPERILVPLDGSADAEQIMPSVAAIATATGATVELLCVVDPSGDDGDGDDALRGAAARLRATGLHVDTRVLACDSAASGILEVAHRDDCGMIALTSRAHGIGRLIGGVADKVIRGGPPLVLLARTAER